jgi:hypothetical protein
MNHSSGTLSIVVDTSAGSGPVDVAVQLVHKRALDEGHGAGDAGVFGIGGVASLFQLERVQVRIGEHEPHGVHLAGDGLQDAAVRRGAPAAKCPPLLRSGEELRKAAEFDPADNMDLDKTPEDFGKTLV